MTALLDTPLDEVAARLWNRVDPAYRRAFLVVLGVNVLAFGFEMSNLTLHHDDVSHIFIQDTILGHYLGRFGFGRLHYYTQNAYIMPFVQTVEGILLMSAYGVSVARFWGLRKALDVVLVSSILSVFPYVAQLYQYNACTAPFALAHLLAAGAVILSVRATPVAVLLAALLYLGAFSIYQSVIANAATIFCIWALGRVLFAHEDESATWTVLARSAAGALLAVGAGGLAYVAAVSAMDLQFDSYQAAGEAFTLRGALDLRHAAAEVLRGSQAFLVWPESYLPGYVKKTQLVLLFAAALLCTWLPKGATRKVGAFGLLVLAVFAPRLLQLIHPAGHYHSLTLTAYAVLIAGCVMIIHRSGHTLSRNLSTIVAAFLIAAYVLQSGWISTVNYLNTLAHYTTLTQILTRIRSLPDVAWDGKRIVVIGRYDMRSDYPFKAATGVATEYLDPAHMQRLAALMRDDAVFLAADGTTPGALEYAATHMPWPHPDSVAVVDGMGVVILSKN